MAINQVVMLVASAEALLSRQFDPQKEIALILEQSEDNYAALIDALEESGYADVADYLDEHEIPETCINIDWKHIEFYAENVFSKVLEFLVPFEFDADWVAKELLHNG